VYGSTVYAAGFFSMIGGKTRNLVAELNASDGSATSFDPNGAPGFGAFALAVALDGTLYVGGSFDTFDLAYQQGFAQFSFAPTGGVVPEGSPWLLLLAAIGLPTALVARRGLRAPGRPRDEQAQAGASTRRFMP
jgi:hypothetical protein